MLLAIDIPHINYLVKLLSYLLGVANETLFTVGVSQHEHDTFLSCVLSYEATWTFLDIKQWKGDVYV